MSDVFLPHPKYSGYVFNINGKCIALKSGVVVNGTVSPAGYRQTTVCGFNSGHHRLVWEAFRGTIPPNHQIHHIDGDKLNNALPNLECLSSTDHSRVTRKEHKRPNNNGKSIAIIRISGDGVRVPFPSTNEAVRQTPGTHHSAIILCIHGKRKTHAGFRWERALGEEIEGEVWAAMATGHCRGVLISSKGRFLIPGTGMPSFGVPMIGYRVFGYKSKRMYVHRLVCLAFHGHAPGRDHQVDHIDRNKANNDCDNLRWVDRWDQAANRRPAERVCGKRERVDVTR